MDTDEDDMDPDYPKEKCMPRKQTLSASVPLGTLIVADPKYDPYDDSFNDSFNDVPRSKAPSKRQKKNKGKGKKKEDPLVQHQHQPPPTEDQEDQMAIPSQSRIIAGHENAVLKAQIAKLERGLDALGKMLAERDSEIANLKAEIASLKRGMAERDAEIASLKRT